MTLMLNFETIGITLSWYEHHETTLDVLRTAVPDGPQSITRPDLSVLTRFRDGTPGRRRIGESVELRQSLRRSHAGDICRANPEMVGPESLRTDRVDTQSG